MNTFPKELDAQLKLMDERMAEVLQTMDTAKKEIAKAKDATDAESEQRWRDQFNRLLACWQDLKTARAKLARTA